MPLKALKAGAAFALRRAQTGKMTIVVKEQKRHYKNQQPIQSITVPAARYLAATARSNSVPCEDHCHCSSERASQYCLGQLQRCAMALQHGRRRTRCQCDNYDGCREPACDLDTWGRWRLSDPNYH